MDTLPQVIQSATSAPLPNLLIVVGLAILLLAIVNDFKDWVHLDRTGRTSAYLAAPILVCLGLAMHAGIFLSTSGQTAPSVTPVVSITSAGPSPAAAPRVFRLDSVPQSRHLRWRMAARRH